MTKRTGVLAWFAGNPIAANLLMLLIMLGGALSFQQVEKEVVPRLAMQRIVIEAHYPNASLSDIEEAVCNRIENAIYQLAGIKRINTEIVDGLCSVKVSLFPNYKQDDMIHVIRSAVQGISRLPKEVESINVKPEQHQDEDGVIWVALHGDTDALSLQSYALGIQSELEHLAGVRLVRNYNEVPYEISINVKPEVLQKYQLSLHDITLAVRQVSLNQSSGLIKHPAGDLSLQIQNRAVSVEQLARIPLRSNADGAQLLLGEVARIQDGLAEKEAVWHHNGETAQGWELYARDNAVEVARRVKQYVIERQKTLPNGLSLKTWWDDSLGYDERVETLIEDGISGFFLVCLVLTLFLQARIALWAGIGIFTSVLGALCLLPALDISLNMLSLFGFLLAMGILVDDAIIIGERIFSEQQANPQQSPVLSAIRGVNSVALPVSLSVLISLIAFLPTLFLPVGWAGQMMRPIGWVMVLTLLFSLLEALLILPAHLAVKVVEKPDNYLSRWRESLNKGLTWFIERCYRPLLSSALEWRYAVLASFLVLILLSSVLVASGRVRLALQADVVKDSFWVSLTVPSDMPHSETYRRAKQVEQAFLALRAELNAQHPEQPDVIVGLETITWEHGAGFWTEFSPEGRQRLIVQDFIRDWRKRIGDLGRCKIDFIYKEGDVPYDLELNLTADNSTVLQQAGEAVKQQLSHYTGVYDVVDSTEAGKAEIQLSLKPLAQSLGLSVQELAQQVNHAYYGEEVQRLQRGRAEVKINVRYPLSERQSLEALQTLPIRLADGQFVPLAQLADCHLVEGVAKIVRQDRQRILKIQARVDNQQADVNALYQQLQAREFKTLKQQFPHLQIEAGQDYQEQQALMASLQNNTLFALAVIYALIAIPFRSYSQPLIFLLAAPVAWCGGVLAHVVAGFPLSLESLVGMIAASGVVINDSLVLVDALAEQSADKSVTDSIVSACTQRFRAIFLAFLTNFAGFFPMLLETSPQAQFLIPMTLSLSAGLLFGMGASLVLTPVCYSVLKDKNLS